MKNKYIIYFILTLLFLIAIYIPKQPTLYNYFRDKEESHGANICTAAGCENGVWIYLDIFDSENTIRNSTLRVCQGLKCLESKIDPKTLCFNMPAEAYDIYKDYSGARASGCVNKVDEGKYSLSIDWVTGYNNSWMAKFFGFDHYSIKNGDKYRVLLKDSEGKQIVKFEKTVNYTRTQPNGKGCGPICYSSHIDFRTTDNIEYYKN